MPVVPGKKETVADRHNNPLNIKYGGATRRHVDEGRAQLGEKATDGGQFLRFNSPEEGFQAGRDLLFGSNYSGLSVDAAMRKWSNSGYGADVAGMDGNLLISQLSPEQRESLLHGMAKREGFSGSREQEFQKWYAGWAAKAGLDPNPDSPMQKYDYRAAFAAGVTPQIDPGDGLYHWPSEFKAQDHPNRFVGGVDTITGLPMFSGVISGSTSTAGNLESDSWAMVKESIAKQSAARLNLSLSVGQKQNPDQAAEAQALSKKTGIPQDVVGRNLDQVRQQAQYKDFETFLKDAPKLAGWLQDPKNVAVAHDDLPSLSALERLLNAGRALTAGAYGIVPGALGLLETAYKGIRIGTEAEILGPAAADYEDLARNPISAGPEVFLEKHRRAKQATLEYIRGKQEGAGPMERAVYSGIESVGAVVSKLPLGPGGLLAAMGAQTAGASATKATDQGVSPAVALAFGSLDGAIEVGTEFIPVSILFKSLSGNAGFVRSIVTQMATELPGEQAATALQDLNAWVILPENKDKTFTDYMNERPGAAAQTLVATVVGTLGQAGVARIANQAMNGGKPPEVVQAEAAKVQMETAAAAVAESATFQRLPQAIQDLLSQMRPEDQVYLPVEAVQKYFQTSGENPQEWSERLTGDAQAYEKALSTGEDIAVPFSAYLAQVATSPAGTAFNDEFRAYPEAMNGREAAEFAAATEPLELSTESVDSSVDSRQSIEDDLRGQMTGLGYSPREVDAHAKFIASVFENIGERYGVDPFQLYEPYKLTLNRPLPEILQKLPNADPQLDTLIDRLRAGNLPSQSEMFGPSLVDFLREKGGVVDEGGDRASREADSDRKAFERNLIQEKGIPLDRAREMAAEAGYLPEESSVSDFLDLISDELRGQPTFSRKSENTAAVEQKVVLEQLADYLKSRDIDLAGVSNEEVRTILKQAGTPEEGDFNQAAYHGSPHKFEEFSLQKIGTGEGAQAYGWGLYFAGRKEVAQYYRDALAPNYLGPVVRQHAMEAKRVAESEGLSGTEAKIRAIKYLNDKSEKVRQIERQQWYDAANNYDILTSGELPGRLFKVDIPEDSEYLDYDKPLSEQNDKVKAALQGVAGESYQAWREGIEFLAVDELLKIANSIDRNNSITEEWDSETTNEQKADDLLSFFDQVHDYDPEAVEKYVSANFTENQRGRGIYDQLVALKGGPEAASRYLASLGIPGIKFADGQSRGKEGGSSNYVLFDDKLIKVLEYEQSLGQDIQGSLSIGPGRKMSISLFETADLSTALHESGHFFLEVFGDIVDDLRTKPGGLGAQQQQMVKDFDATLEWMGVESRDKIQREQHEQWARGFEAYLREGKAPNPELRSIFARFSAWLKAIYKELRQLNVSLSPEIVAVFDRLVASDAQIEAAEQEAHIEGLLEDQKLQQELGLSPEELAVYGAAVEKARDKRRNELNQEYLEEYFRTSEDWYQKKRAEVRAEVAAVVHGKQEYIALSFLRDGKLPDGSPLPDGIEGKKLDAKSLEDQYGKYKDSSVMKGLRNLRVYAREGGIDPNAAAELLGYSSADELVQSLLNARPMDPLIDAETDSRMRAEYGDIRLDGRAPEKAKDAVMTIGRAEVLEAEMKALARKVRELRPAVNLGRNQERSQRRAEADAFKRLVPPLRAIRNIAEKRIREMKVRDVRAGMFWAAARRASDKATAFALEGKYEEALSAKVQELLSVEMYRAAKEAQKDVAKIVETMRSFDESKVRARIGKAGESYIEQIDKLRERYSFKNVPLKQADKRSKLKDWIEAREQEGLPVDLPDYLLDEAQRVDWRNVPVEELRGLEDSVNHIAHLARLKNKLLKAKEKRDFRETADGLVSSIDGNAKGPRRKVLEPRLPTEDLGRMASAFFASHRKFSEILRQMDGFKDGGALWESIVRPINDAAETETTRNAEATKALTDLFNQAFKGRQSQVYAPRVIPGAGFSLSKQGAIMFALNWGNDGNRQRLMTAGLGRSGPLTPQQAQAILDSLDERDWTFVRGIWKYIDSFWGEISDKQQRVEGVRPEKVEASPFQTKFGEMPGGYFPIQYEGRVDPAAQGKIDAEFGDSIKMAANVKATTRRGHTKERLQNVTRPVRLDFDVITQHVQSVIHDLTHHETLIDVGRLLGDKAVAQAMVDHYGDVVYDTLKGHVKDVAWGNAPTPRWYQPFNNFRQGSVVAGLGWNAMTAVLQPLGAFDAIRPVGARNMYKGVTRFARNAAHMESTSKWIQERSPFMANRHRTQFREMNEIRNRVGLNSGRVTGWVRDSLFKMGVDPSSMPVLTDSFFYFIQKGQQVADTLTFLGAYEKFIEDPKNSEDRAVALAEQMVIHTQGSGHIKDLAAVEKGNPILKLFTTFYSYQNKQLQLNYEAFKKTDYKMPKSVGRLLVDSLFFIMVPAALYMALHGGADDDETTAEAFGKQLAGDALGPFVFIREFGGMIHGYDYKGPSGLSWISNVTNAGKQISQGEADEALFKAINKTMGAFWHYPATQVERTALGLNALWEGRTQNPAALLFGPPKD